MTNEEIEERFARLEARISKLEGQGEKDDERLRMKMHRPHILDEAQNFDRIQQDLKKIIEQ